MKAGMLCPNCESGKLRVANGLEWLLTMACAFLHCDICGATWFEVTKNNWQRISVCEEG